MRTVTRRALAGLGATALLAGCSVLPVGTQGRVESLVKDAGGEVFTQLWLTPDPSQIVVQVRTPTGLAWWDVNGVTTAPEGMAETAFGSTRPSAVDFAALNDELAAHLDRCREQPRLEIHVAATGALVSDAVCGVGEMRAVMSTSVAGEPPSDPAIDFASEEGLTRFFAEAEAFLPGGKAYQLTFPGAALSEARGEAEGGLWVLADGTECMVSFARSGDVPVGAELRLVGCDGRGPQSVDGTDQEEFRPTQLDAQIVWEAIDEGLAAQGVDAADVERYGIHNLLYPGPELVIITAHQVFRVPLLVELES